MGKFSRAIVSVTVAALASGLAAVVGAAPASAVPTMCDPNSTWTKVTGSRSYRITHVRGYHALPGGSIKLTKSASFERQLTAGISVTAGASVSADGVIAKAEASYSVNLAASGSKTSTYGQSVEFTLGASSGDRYYAVYAGRRYWTGRWEKWRCNGNGTDAYTVGYGNWRSFQSHLEGAALCPASRYSSGSLPYKACRLTWS